MIDFEFQNQMQRLTGTFGKNHFSDERMALIWRTVKELNKRQFENIVDHFLASFRQAPLPADFLKAYYEERRAAMTQQTTFQGSAQAEEKPLDCLECAETGFCFVKDETIQAPILMRCSCQMGANAVASHIPQWRPEIGGLFPRQKFPMEGFKPKLRIGEEVMGDGFWARVERWKARIQFSEDYWKHQIESHKKAQESNGLDVGVL